MTIPSWAFNDLIRRLKDAAENHPDLEERAAYQSLYELVIISESDLDDIIFEARGIGLRNPAFDGDMVGWLDDDFDDDEDDKDE